MVYKGTVMESKSAIESLFGDPLILKGMVRALLMNSKRILIGFVISDLVWTQVRIPKEFPRTFQE